MSFVIKCPNCGDRSVYEFRFGGEVRSRPSQDASVDEWLRYTYSKNNTAGEHTEWWYHRSGCQQWFQTMRNTVTNEVVKTFLPGEHGDEGTRVDL